MYLTDDEKKVLKSIGDNAFVHCFKQEAFSYAVGETQKEQDFGFLSGRNNCPFGSGFYAVSPKAFESTPRQTIAGTLGNYKGYIGIDGRVGKKIDNQNPLVLFKPKNEDTVQDLKKLVKLLDFPQELKQNHWVILTKPQSVKGYADYLNIAPENTEDWKPIAKKVDESVAIIQRLRESDCCPPFTAQLNKRLKHYRGIVKRTLQDLNKQHKSIFNYQIFNRCPQRLTENELTDDYLLRIMIQETFLAQMEQFEQSGKDGKPKQSETVFSLFMKKFCDGIDVRHMPKYDDFITGSVLFRLQAAPYDRMPSPKVKTKILFENTF